MRAGTARGFRDILPSEALARERIVGMVQACLTGYGYVPVETPLLELHETFERVGKPRIPSFQLFDSESGPLVLRSDLTMPIARMVSERTDESSLPLRSISVIRNLWVFVKVTSDTVPQIVSYNAEAIRLSVFLNSMPYVV